MINLLLQLSKRERKESIMSLGITWITIEDAAAKYSLEKTLILKWVEEGVVRADQAEKESVRINVDDLELKVQEKAMI
jgi:hypothetical protein